MAPQESTTVLGMVTIEVVVNSILVLGIRVTIYCRYCIALEAMLLVSSYRQDAAKRQTARFKLTHRPKIRFFAPHGRLVAPIHVNLGRADGHAGPLRCAKYHVNRHRRVRMRPQKYQTFPPFGKESGDRFRKFLRVFIRLTNTKTNTTFSHLQPAHIVRSSPNFAW